MRFAWDLIQGIRGKSITHDSARASRILIVDDEQAIREIVSSMLENEGYECEAASDGLDALTILNSSRPFDLLLTNLLMPRLDGVGLLERVKKEFPDMEVMFETAVKDLSVTLACYRHGAYDYLLKPYTRWQLTVAVRRALEDQRLKMEIRSYCQSGNLIGSASGHKQSRILVVEADQTSREKNCSELVAVGYECTEASTGRQALFSLEHRGQFDSLLIEETLPEIRGSSVLEIAKTKYPDMVAIMATGVQDISRAESAIRHGFFDYIRKPFPPQLLVIIVRRALEHRRLVLESRCMKAEHSD